MKLRLLEAGKEVSDVAITTRHDDCEADLTVKVH
jgi:hypothetical protein